MVLGSASEIHVSAYNCRHGFSFRPKLQWILVSVGVTFQPQRRWENLTIIATQRFLCLVFLSHIYNLSGKLLLSGLKVCFVFNWNRVDMGYPGGSDGEKSTCNAWNPGLIPMLGGSSGEGNGYPLQYSCLENPMDRGAWWATVHGSQRVVCDWMANTFTLSELVYSVSGVQQWL